MIGRLRGVLLEKAPPHLLLEVAGVAYEVLASMTTFYRLPEAGHEIVLHTHFVVREDAQQLYGFSDVQERALFRSLIKVNGVGPKMALTILSSIEPHDFVQCVTENDAASLTRLPGVGKKTADRLIVEMRDRLSDWYENVPQSELLSSSLQLPLRVKKSATQEAISALIALGYKPQEASRAVSQIDTEGLSSEALIRLALKNML